MARKKQMKDQRFRYTTIKIDLIREVFKLPKNRGTEYKDKLFCVEIDIQSGTTSFCEPKLRKLFKRIKEELHL